jgi:mercuric ion transport protein
MKDKALIGASLVAGVAASLCCILPIVFALAGAGIVGASAFFERWRPLLLGITFALLGLGFYFAYRKPKQACAPGSACERPAINRAGRLWLWIASIFTLLFAAFPYYSGPVADLLLSERSTSHDSSPQAAEFRRASFAIDGMTCASCAKSVENKLRELKGVQAVNVSYEKSRADVEFDPVAVTVEQIQEAIQKAGYKVRSS